MSDPADGPYTCLQGHPLGLVEFRDIYDGGAAWFCHKCGIWRHRFPPDDPRRADVEQAMAAFLAGREGAQTP